MHFRLTLLILLAAGLDFPAFGQGRSPDGAITPSVIVTLGKPNVWTMEQAHYLLEKNRAHDLGIATADLGPLDANEIVGYRLEAIKSLLAAQVQYDATVGKKNNATVSQYNTDMARYNLLRNQSDELRTRQASLASELAGAQAQLAALQAENPQDAKKIAAQNADITRITQEQAAANSEATSLSQALSTEPTLSNLTSSVPTTDETTQSAIGTNSTFATMLSGVPTGLSNSKVQASIKLDNYINLQYEIVAKQLTLLRDEAGPGNRVLFVELPQSIYVTRKFKPYPDVAAFWGNYLVQTWWRLSGVVTADVTEQVGAALEGCAAETAEAGNSDLQPVRPPDLHELKQIAEIQQLQEKALMQFFHLHETPDVEKKLDVKSLAPASRAHFCAWSRNWRFSVYDVNHGSPNDPDQAAYTLDLIPRQSALNVAEAQSTSRAYGFAGLIGLISGFGAKARYEQQKDTYSQFAQQEAYASAFGKGQNTFGWTFGPLPGTKRMAPGLRTTYAVLVVPNTARVVRMEGIGCGYRQRSVPKDPFQYDDGQDSDEDCGKKVSYDMEIPSGDDSFYLDKVFYKPVPAGQRMSLELQGTFGTQIGILVNGTPLQKVVSLGQPLLEQTAFNIPGNAGESGIQGVYEMVGKTKILMSFVVPATFSGTPRISLISPGHAAVINSYSIKVYDGAGSGTRKLDDAAPMFFLPLTISRVTPIYDHSTTQTQGADPSPTLLLEFFGQSLGSGANRRLLVNGHQLALQDPLDLDAELSMNEYRVIGNGLIQARIDRKLFFPHYTADYFEFDNQQNFTASINYDDDGPEEFASCTITTVDANAKTAQIQVKGDFFNLNYVPVSSTKDFTVTSTTLKSSSEWTVTGTITGNVKQGQLTLKGPNVQNSLPIPLNVCTLVPPPTPKPAALKTPKPKADESKLAKP